MARKFNVAEWAKDQAQASTGCGTCLLPEVAEAIEVVLEMNQSGEASVSVIRLHEMLVREFDYPLQITALRNHIRRCARRSSEAEA